MSRDDVKTQFWHDFRPLMEAAIDADDTAAFDTLRVRALSAFYVRKDGDRIFAAADDGKPYDSMNQTDMAVCHLRAAVRWGGAGLIGDAIRLLRPVLDEAPPGHMPVAR